MTRNVLSVLIGFDQDSEERLIKIQNHIYDHGFCGTQIKSFPYHILAKTISYNNKDQMVNLLLQFEQHQSFPLFVDKLIITDDHSSLALHCQFDQSIHDLSDQLNAQLNKAQIILLKDFSELIEQAYQLLLPVFEPFTVTVNKLYLYDINVIQHLLTVELKSK
jgi:hypothetical protein